MSGFNHKPLIIIFSCGTYHIKFDIFLFAKQNRSVSNADTGCFGVELWFGTGRETKICSLAAVGHNKLLHYFTPELINYYRVVASRSDLKLSLIKR